MSDLGNNRLELILFLWTRTFLFIFYRIIRERRNDFIFLLFFPTVNGGGAREIEVATLRTASSTDKTFAHPPLSSSLGAGFSVLSHWPLKEDVGFFRSPRVLRVFNLVSCVLLTLSRRAYEHLSVSRRTIIVASDSCVNIFVTNCFFPTSFIRHFCFTSRD